MKPRCSRRPFPKGAGAVWLTALAVGGCTWTTGTLGELDQAPEEFPILWEKAGSHCNLTRPMQLVARSQAEMAWCPISDVPVDFSREMVLVAALGRVTSEGYAIRIERVWRDGSMIKADVRTYRPPPTTQGTLQLSSPYHVVVVPRSDLNVEGFTPHPPRPKRGVSPLFEL